MIFKYQQNRSYMLRQALRVIIAAAGVFGLCGSAHAEVMTAGVVMEKMSAEERFTFWAGIIEGLVLGLQRVDLVHQRAGRLDLAVVRGAKDLLGNRSNTQHILSVPVFRYLVNGNRLPRPSHRPRTGPRGRPCL